MRLDIVPGAVSREYELSDHRGMRRTLSELQRGDPLVLVLSHGDFCPKGREDNTKSSRNSTARAVLLHGIRDANDGDRTYGDALPYADTLDAAKTHGRSDVAPPLESPAEESRGCVTL